MLACRRGDGVVGGNGTPTTTDHRGPALPRPQPRPRHLRQAIAPRGRLATLSLEARFDLVCTQALLAALASNPGSKLTDAEEQGAADKAMEMLRQVIVDGWRDLTQMRTDKDLDALRKRPDFQKALAELEAKEKAKNP